MKRQRNRQVRCGQVKSDGQRGGASVAQPSTSTTTTHEKGIRLTCPSQQPHVLVRLHVLKPL